MQGAAFETYMKKVGAWMGLCFAASAMNDLGVKKNWDWHYR
jgi:hypothetical protein